MTPHAYHSGGDVIGRDGARYTVAQCRTIALICQQLADWAADKGEIEQTSYYAAVAVDFIYAGKDAERWARAGVGH